MVKLFWTYGWVLRDEAHCGADKGKEEAPETNCQGKTSILNEDVIWLKGVLLPTDSKEGNEDPTSLIWRNNPIKV